MQDFVRLPWQNQSNQNSNAVTLGPSAPPSGALHRGYGSGSVSGHMNSDIFSSGINVAQSLDAEDMEPTSVKLLRYDWSTDLKVSLLYTYVVLTFLIFIYVFTIIIFLF